jgi:hypothetical protein
VRLSWCAHHRILLRSLEEADRLAGSLSTRPAGPVPPFLRAQVTRAKALVAPHEARGRGGGGEPRCRRVDVFATSAHCFMCALANTQTSALEISDLSWQ